ncbi:MAG: HAD family hydrolase [Verrucomicrobia bacterium]|nr:HAD family hydrolase [Verrucomicrobiota bacterium]
MDRGSESFGPSFENVILKKYRHLIWDWNGTLLDDAWLCREIMNGQLRKRGLPAISQERYEAVFDFPVEKYYRTVGFEWGKETFAEAGTEFIVEYEKRKKECRLQSGAKELLRKVEGHGISQAVLSAYSHHTLEEFLRHFGVRAHFRSVAGNRDHYAAGKVEQGLEMLRELHVRPEETALIGDTTHDAEVARAMGVDCFLIPCGHNSRDRLERCGVPLVAGLGDFLTG